MEPSVIIITDGSIIEPSVIWTYHRRFHNRTVRDMVHITDGSIMELSVKWFFLKYIDLHDMKKLHVYIKKSIN